MFPSKGHPPSKLGLIHLGPILPYCGWLRNPFRTTFVGIYKRIIIPGFLGWSKMDDPQNVAKTPCSLRLQRPKSSPKAPLPLQPPPPKRKRQQQTGLGLQNGRFRWLMLFYSSFCLFSVFVSFGRGAKLLSFLACVFIFCLNV